jgi:L-alanine-DL-glutamate epimerase-like enolase superfamily enzyme
MRITELTVQNYRQPMVALHRKRFAGEQEISLVTVKTDAGVEGYAMARAQGGTSGMVIGEHLVKTAAPRIIGENPLDRERIWQRLFDLEHGMYMPIFVTSAIDVALWDIAGKVMGQPVYRVLGGYRDRIVGYASSAHLESVDEYLEDARQSFDLGFRAYKIHPFRDPDRDIDLCRVLRREFGDGVILMLDSGSAYTRRDAIRVGRAIEELGFYWFEEPLSHYDPEGNRELRQALDIPIVGAETMAGSAFTGVQNVVQGAFDMILCDVYWKMGITGMMKTARACEALHVPIASHHAASPIMNFANLHCLCAMANADFIEILVPEDSYNHGLLHYVGIDHDGYATVPDAPGLGVEIDWDYVDANTTSRL